VRLEKEKQGWRFHIPKEKEEEEKKDDKAGNLDKMPLPPQVVIIKDEPAICTKVLDAISKAENCKAEGIAEESLSISSSMPDPRSAPSLVGIRRRKGPI